MFQVVFSPRFLPIFPSQLLSLCLVSHFPTSKTWRRLCCEIAWLALVTSVKLSPARTKPTHRLTDWCLYNNGKLDRFQFTLVGDGNFPICRFSASCLRWSIRWQLTDKSEHYATKSICTNLYTQNNWTYYICTTYTGWSTEIILWCAILPTNCKDYCGRLNCF